MTKIGATTDRGLHFIAYHFMVKLNSNCVNHPSQTDFSFQNLEILDFFLNLQITSQSFTGMRNQLFFSYSDFDSGSAIRFRFQFRPILPGCGHFFAKTSFLNPMERFPNHSPLLIE